MCMVGSNHTFSAIKLIDSFLKNNEKYYLQVFLKECEYIEKEKRWLLMTIKDD